MRYAVSALTIVCVSSFCTVTSAQSRVWRDVYGNTSTGTFQRFRKDSKGDPGNDRVVVRAAGRIVGLKYWELMPDSQQFVKDQLIGKPDGDHLEITDVPHDWTSRSGVKGTGQFLKVEQNGQIAVVIASEKKLFDFAEFCDADQDYIRSVLARSGQDALVPARPETQTSPSNQPPTTTPGSPFTPPGFPNTPQIPGQEGFPSSPPPGFGAPGSIAPGSTGPPTSTIGSGGSFTTTAPPDISSPPSTSALSFPNSATSIPGSLTNGTSHFQPPRHETPEISMPSGPAFEEVYSCSQCGKDVTKKATSCPHCDARFDYVEDQFGNKTDIAGGSSSVGGRGLRGLIKIGAFIVIGAGGFLLKLFSNRS